MRKKAYRGLALLLSVAMIFAEGSIAIAAESIREQEIIEECSETEEQEEAEQESLGEENSEEETVSESFEEDVSSEETFEEESTEGNDASEEVSEESELEEAVDEDRNEEASEEESCVETDESDGDKGAALFPGMGTDYVPSAVQTELRKEMISHADELNNVREGIDYVANQIVVRAEDESDAKACAKAYGGRLEAFRGNMALIVLNEREETEPETETEVVQVTVMDAVKASLVEENQLPVAWPNYYWQYCGNVEEIVTYGTGGAELNAYNDPELSKSSQDDADYQWYHALIGSKYAWDAGYTGKGVKIGLISTGIRSGHEDVSAADGIGHYTDDYEDYDGYGTHDAGVIVAKPDNGKGGVGVAPDAELFCVKMSKSESLNSAVPHYDIYWGMLDAIEAECDIIVSGYAGKYFTEIISSMASYSNEIGALFVGPAANENTKGYWRDCMKGDLCVGGLNKGNERSQYSSFGEGIDFMMPGEDIYSTYHGADTNGDGKVDTLTTNAYASMTGPASSSVIMAGCAAVALQYVREKGLIDETLSGPERVEAFVDFLSKGAVPVEGEGTGLGYFSLPKALGLKTDTEKPEVPVLSMKGGTYEEEKLTVSFTENKRCDIYYSVNGKTPTYKNGVIKNGELYTKAFAIEGASKVTVKAIAVNKETKLISKVMTETFVLKPKVSSVKLIGEGGASSVGKGKKLKLIAEVKPSNAANRKLRWSVDGTPEGISVNASGVVTVKKNATVSSCVIRAVTTDGSNVAGSISIKITENTNPVTAVKVSAKSVSVVNGISKEIEVVTTHKDKSKGGAELLSWSCEDTAVATVSVTSDGKLKITGGKKGKTRIIGMAKDGSGKKVSIQVTTGVGISSISLSGSSVLKAGKSTTITVLTVPADATNRKFDWSVTPAGVGVSVKNGKVTASKKAERRSYTITAMAKDGTGKSASITIKVTDDVMKSMTLAEKKVSLFRVAGEMHAATSKTIAVKTTGGNAEAFSVSTNKPELLSVTKSGGNIVLKTTGKGTGTATVTVKSTDGSNKKATCKVTVNNPLSSIGIVIPQGRSDCLAQTKTLKLKVVTEALYGKVSSQAKKFKWESLDPELVSVTKKGVVTALKSSGTARIRVSSLDGSATTVMEIRCVGLIERMDYINNKITVNLGGDVQVGFTADMDISGDTFKEQVMFIPSGNKLLFIERNYWSRAIFTCCGLGEYTIDVRTTDGSDLEMKYYITVQ